MGRHKIVRDNPSPAAQTDPNAGNRSAQIITHGTTETDNMHSLLSAEELPVMNALDLDTPTEVQPVPDDAPNSPPIQAEPAPERTQQNDPDDVDDPRFKGKSKREIFESYRHLESKLGEQGQEVARFREYFDQTIRREAAPRPAQNEPNPEEDAQLLNEILTKPKQFVDRIKRTALEEVIGTSARATVTNMKQQNAATLTDPNFAAWLRNNVPHETAARADSDPATLHLILSAYRGAAQPQAAPTKPETPPVDRTATSQRIVNAAASPTQSKQQGDGKTYYSRSQIMALRLNDPAKYEAMQGEISRAYEEGRIKP
jgi:hypothetical protein